MAPTAVIKAAARCFARMAMGRSLVPERTPKFNDWRRLGFDAIGIRGGYDAGLTQAVNLNCVLTFNGILSGGRPMHDHGLSEEQRLMRQSCRAFVDDVVIPFMRRNWQREWIMTPEDRLPPEILEGADKIGIRTLGVPAEFGGTELDPASEVQTFAMIAEEIARGDSGLSDKLVQIWKVSVLLRNLAPRHLQERWFPRIVADPQFLLAHCLTEPRGASDRWLPYNVPEAAMQTRAVKKNGEWVINGRKQFISNGYDASLYVVYANTDPKVGMLQGTSSFLVPRDTPGLTVARCNETMGCRFMNHGELVFEDMRVPADHLLVENDALGKAGIYFRPGKIIQASKNLGVGVRAYELHGGNGVMLDFGVEKIFRDAAIFLHMDATADISKMKIVKSMFPATAGK